MRVHSEVADSLAAGRTVVALESTVISQGLPRPDNLHVAREIEDAVRSAGTAPPTITIIDGHRASVATTRHCTASLTVARGSRSVSARS